MLGYGAGGRRFESGFGQPATGKLYRPGGKKVHFLNQGMIRKQKKGETLASFSHMLCSSYLLSPQNHLTVGTLAFTF